MAWFSERALQLCRRAWEQAEVEQRCRLSVVGCFCKAMYLRVAREILENATSRAERDAADQLHQLDVMTWGVDITTLFMLSDDFCQRADGFEFLRRSGAFDAGSGRRGQCLQIRFDHRDVLSSSSTTAAWPRCLAWFKEHGVA
jgi:hypothetical protein